MHVQRGVAIAFGTGDVLCLKASLGGKDADTRTNVTCIQYQTPDTLGTVYFCATIRIEFGHMRSLDRSSRR